MNRHVPSQTMSSREFNQNTGRAKQAAGRGPVVITDRGKPAYVLMRYEDYRKLGGDPREGRPVSLLAIEQVGGPEYDFEIELPERRVEPMRDPFAGDTE